MGTAQLVQGNYKRFSLLSLLIAGFFAFPALPANAATRIHLDAATVAKGYTVQNANNTLRLGIPAGAFSESTRVSIRKPKSQEYLDPDIGNSWVWAGKAHTYNISMSSPQTLEHPVWLSLSVPAQANYDYTMAYFDRESSQWVTVPTEINWFEDQITAALPFPYATVAALATPHLGPRQSESFNTATSELGNLQAASAIILDVDSGQVLYEKNADEVRSIASMTKMATAWTALQHVGDWSEQVTYSSNWDREGAFLHVVDGETMTVGDLLYTTLVGSANNTAVGLANIFTDQTSFINEMNLLAKNLGLSSTHFVEPSGLDAGNVSTAHEYALLARAALQNFDLLQLTTTKEYSFLASQTGVHTIHTTNALLNSDLYITGGKTGYTEEAGNCLMVKAKSSSGHELVAVVMGEPTSADRFTETYALVEWAFENYTWD